MKKSSKTKLSILALLIAAAAALAITCPGREAHKNAIADAVNADLLGQLNIDVDDSSASSLKYTNRMLIEPFLRNDLIVTSYGVFSSSYIIDDGKKVKFGFGILGKVHIKDPENIHRRIPVLREPMPVALLNK
ncbi:MAG: hypothetical protein II527_06150 [Bacteroidales bacterium]|nr:hypothetical protein [Bacteroidales bacterium]